MAFPTGFNMDNGVLLPQRARGRFILPIFEQAESVRRETSNVSETEHSAVQRFTFHVLPFTVLESDFLSILLAGVDVEVRDRWAKRGLRLRTMACVATMTSR